MKEKILFVLLSLSSLIYTGVIFGWPSLQQIFIEEGVFQELCEPNEKTCEKQQSRYFLLYLLFMIFYIVSQPVVGKYVDRFGSRTGIITCGLVLIPISSFIMAFFRSLDSIIIGMLLLTFTTILFQSILKLSELYPKHKSIFLTTINLLFDSSIVIFGFFEIIHQYFELKYIFICFAIFSLILHSLIAFLLREPMDEQRIQNFKKLEFGNDPEDLEQENISIISNKEKENENGTKKQQVKRVNEEENENEKEEEEEETKEEENNSVSEIGSEEDETDQITKKKLLLDKIDNNFDWELLVFEKYSNLNLTSKFKTGIFISQSLIFCFTCLTIILYPGSLGLRMSTLNVSFEQSGKYIQIFIFLQLGCILFAYPVAKLLTLPFDYAWSLVLILEITFHISNLFGIGWHWYSFISFMIIRAINFSAGSYFIAKIFGYTHFSQIYTTQTFLSSILLLIQFPVNTLIEKYWHSFFYADLFFLIISILLIAPAYYLIKIRKKFQKPPKK
ncbi:protein fmp42 [Anaeramoeba flamelloides]|uniref:Protein fmp42 n=1 Tax=Anaeramoeba flamelloides TaxID=1746091 RepID=A0AAV7YCN6_9EUKA|nr:protein fmp42 [Anaeramoeba flamelloides]